jgi:MFS family permease
MTATATGVFRSLRSFNYRVWAAGALVSNVGTWMQRTAQDWLVLTQLTHHNASAVGTVMALQFGPQLLLLPWTGFAADHYNQRKLLIATQATMGALALALGVLTVFRAGLHRLRVEPAGSSTSSMWTGRARPSLMRLMEVGFRRKRVVGSGSPRRSGVIVGLRIKVGRLANSRRTLALRPDSRSRASTR